MSTLAVLSTIIHWRLRWNLLEVYQLLQGFSYISGLRLALYLANRNACQPSMR